MSDDLEVKYRLARTVVKIDGTVTIEIGDDGRYHGARASQVALGCEADPAHQRSVHIDSGWRDQRKFDLKLAADGRLAGSSETSTGLGTQIISSAVTIATVGAKLAASAAFGVALVAAPENGQPPGHAAPRSEPLEEQFAHDKPAVAGRRQGLQTTIDALDGQLITVTSEIGDPKHPLDPDHEAKLTVLQNALTVARAELAALEGEFQTWKTTKFPTRTETFSYVVGTDDLPSLGSVSATTRFSTEQLTAQAECASQLGVVVAIIGPTPTKSHLPDQSGDAKSEHLIYRIPRRIELAIFQRADERPKDADGQQAPEYELKQVMPAWIIDSNSELGVVPLKHGMFQDHATSVTFGDTGTLTEISNDDTPATSGIATAVGGLGGQITGALNDASKISAAFAPAAAPEDPAITALKVQVAKKELEARLATANAVIAQATGSRTSS